MKKIYSIKYSTRTEFFIGARLCNSLPSDIKESKSLEHLISKLIPKCLRTNYVLIFCGVLSNLYRFYMYICIYVYVYIKLTQISHVFKGGQTFYQSLVTSYWLLITSYWSLVTSHRLPVTGHYYQLHQIICKM